MVLLDTGAPVTSRESYSEDVYGGTRTRIPLFCVYNPGVASSSPIIGIKFYLVR